MRLASPESLLLLLGIQSGTGSLAAAGAALDASAPMVEAVLETYLAQSIRSDYFSITKADKTDPVLRLSCGFVSKDENVVVRYQGDTLAADEYEVNYQLGLIYPKGTFDTGNFVFRVDYTAGFEKVSGDTLLKGLPEAITQGSLSMAAAYFLNNPANTTKEKGRFMSTSGVTRYASAAKASFEPFTRPRALTVWAERTEVEE